jgi:hypothetical protein
MDVIRRTIIRDDEQRPIAVHIDYADWLKIEKLLASDPTAEPRTSSLNSHRGCLKLTEDPLQYQIRMRGEWG